MKQAGTSPLVGDRVIFQPAAGAADEKYEGIIEKVLPRESVLHRPPVANVDQMILVTPLRDPAPEWHLTGRLLALAEQQQMKAVLCLNKADLVTAAEQAETRKMLEPFPYPYIFTSAVRGDGILDLNERLSGHCSIFAGPSGAGKSSLLNAVQPGLSLKVGPVSDKIGRGRHTTRTAELLVLPSGGMVVDTPGFSRLEIVDLEPRLLSDLFPEMRPYSGRCAFRDCSHLSEPGCAIREAVSAGEINRMRFQHYQAFFNELKNRRDEY